jgi:CRP/FNR family transcriptional regulator, cyclic AMP receptor protein
MRRKRTAVESRSETERPADRALRAHLLNALDRTPLLQALPRLHRRKVAALAEFAHYDDGATIVRAGDVGDALHVVLMGRVRVTAAGLEDQPLSVGDPFGELSLIDGAPRSATVIADGPVSTARIGRADFQHLVHDEPGFAAGLLPGLALVVRELLRAEDGSVGDHGRVGDWREGADEPTRAEAAGLVLQGRDALGWLLLLRHVAVFAAVPERHLQHVARLVTVERYADGANVVLAGARGDAMHIILNGRARVRTPSGHTATLTEDDCFGELALIDGAPRSATVSALGELTTARITRKDFQKLLKSEPAIAVGLLDGLVRTIRDMQHAQHAL